MKDLNVRAETTKIIKENIGSKILDIACSNILSGISPQASETKEKKNKQMGLHQTKKFLHSNGNINSIKYNPEHERTYSPMYLIKC